MALHVRMIWLFRVVLNAKYRNVTIPIVILNSILVVRVQEFLVAR